MARAPLNVLLIAMFAAALSLPAVDMLTGLVDGPAIDENRNLAPFPATPRGRSTLRAFPAGFENWFADHMGLRGALISAYRAVNQRLLHSNDRVLGGTDGWLYLLRDTSDDPGRLPLPADLCGRNPFSPAQLRFWVDALQRNRLAVEALGARYVLMIIPNKQSVQGGHLPTRVSCRHGPRRLDQLTSRLEQVPAFPMLDLDSVFRRAAADGTQLWLKTDTHWDFTGAALGYRVLIDFVERALGRTLPDPFADGTLEIVPVRSAGWGLSRMRGTVSRDVEEATTLEDHGVRAVSLGDALPEYGRGPLRPSERFENPDGSLPTVLALHDSFFNKGVKSMLAQSFSRADFVWHRGEPLLDQELELIRELEPDVVVHEMAERNLLQPYFGGARR